MSLIIKQNVLLAPYTTFQIGGRAAYFVDVHRPEELVEAVCLAREKKWPYYLVAGGSNVVFGDKTFRGLVVHFKPKASPCHWQGEALTCSANLPLGHLIKVAITHSLAGLEALSGIPGTVGGAIVGNAGAYGQTISDCLVRVEIFDPKTVGHRVSHRRWLTKKQCRFAYRDSIFKKKDWLILRAEFKLTRGDKKLLLQRSKKIVKIRSAKYNSTLRCPGSFFKNVLVKNISNRSRKLIDQAKIREGKIPAGYLLEAVGVKGRRVGGIYVADFHGNLLINDGHGTYRDVITLAAKLKRLVKNGFGIILEEEVRYML